MCAAPSITYTFTNATTADATQVNQNFNDVINGITDGTRDITVGTLVSNGLVTATGAFTAASTVALTGAAIAKTSAPTLNRLYPNSIIKAWAMLTLGAAGAVTVTEGYNVNTASYAVGAITVNFHTALTSANYAPVVSFWRTGSGNGAHAAPNTLLVGSFKIDLIRDTGGLGNWASGDIVYFIVCGT